MGLWKDKIRKDWCYKFQYQKKQYGSRGYTTKKAAIAARELHRKRILTSSKQALSSMGFKQVASLYLDDAKRRFVEKTYKYKVSVYREFLKFHGDLYVHEISPVVIDTYLKTRPSNNNYNVHRKELSALFNYALIHLKVIEFNPVTSINKLPHTSKRKTIPTEEQVKKLISFAEPTAEKPFLLCLLHLAARVDEVCRLTWQDIDFKNRTVTRWTKKRRGGSLESIVTYMNNDLYIQLDALYKNRSNDKWVFYNAKKDDRYRNRRKMLYAICTRAKIDPPIHFHELRHFVASLLANTKDVSKKTISDLLGHKSLSTTEIYLHSIGESKKSAIQSLEGKF